MATYLQFHRFGNSFEQSSLDVVQFSEDDASDFGDLIKESLDDLIDEEEVQVCFLRSYFHLADLLLASTCQVHKRIVTPKSVADDQ